MNKMFKSSADPQKVALTVKGIGLWIIPLVIFAGSQFGLSFVEADLVRLIDSFAVMASAIMIVYGVARKIYFSVKPQA